jgi:hypothetical protein
VEVYADTVHLSSKTRLACAQSVRLGLGLLRPFPNFLNSEPRPQIAHWAHCLPVDGF